MIWNNNKISFKEFVNTFVNTYGKLNIPQIAYDYKDYFKSISSEIELKNQELFFQTQQKSLKSYKKSSLKNKEKLDYEQLNFEIEFNLQRLALEKAWVLEGRNIPEDGLFSLNNHKEWYQYFIKKFTSLDLSPEQIMDLGKTEVKRVKEEIRKIQIESGYLDSASFYKYLKSDAFYITDKKQLIKLFENTDITIRKNLNNFINIPVLPIIYPIEWPESGQNTPPGMYLNHTNNTFGKDVFQFNFFGGRYNKRAIEWLYMHEGIPGHHLQFSLRESDIPNSLQELFLYPGNFEGWACYVEYQGKDLGIFKDIYSYLGKWEWDLVRSARLVIDAGIHNFGWTRQQALEYWKQNIPGQDEIAEREVTRVTNWTAQALSYKVGAECIQKLKEKLMHKYGSDFNIQKFHKCYLSFGLRPLSV
ncbi:MAG TPA: DUF885 domain-containing protein, partial [Saprospiraceae bacterium]|nr:DUF885 domain-containing protein [Saprospiraceae bacterium]